MSINPYCNYAQYMQNSPISTYTQNLPLNQKKTFGDNLRIGDNLHRWQIAEVTNIQGDKYPGWQIKGWQKVVWSYGESF